MFKNLTKFLKDMTAQASMSTMDTVITAAIGLLMLVAVFQMAPLLGDSIDEAADLDADAIDAVAATGTLIPTAEEFEMVEGDSIRIGTTVFEFSLAGGCIDQYAVCIEGVDPFASVLFPMLAEAIETNATTASIVDVEVYKHPLHNVTCMDIIADTPGVGGNAIITTTRIWHAWASFGNETLTGGVDDVSGSDWAADDVPTGVDAWTVNAVILVIVLLVSLLALAVTIIRDIQR